ncbi:hypothetical protein [Nitrospira moscoviensis]|uniref:Lipoprotein n=1 Tax=Nitrospira moscoviensis TaxID=42253 RepID=A0A0K2GBJ4_NITMO|nr:hypothetical protein [Nitrospira moscoviensis]ALA57952.1 conserved exported protein of unknown function [Nitrospira moscoviensis]
MRRRTSRGAWYLSGSLMTAALALSVAACARQPYTTQAVYWSPLVRVQLQHEIEPAGYGHPVALTDLQAAAILRGFSLRAQQRLPLRWFAEEEPPRPLMRDDEIARLAPVLADAFRKAGPEERVHFVLAAPGMNRADSQNVTAGWMAVREPYLYVTIEYFRAEVPLRKTDHYFPNYPLLPPLPGSFLLFFEPGRFWASDRAGVRALEYREFLKSAAGPPAS